MLWNKLKGDSGKIHIDEISPSIGLPGGWVTIKGKNFRANDLKDYNLIFSNSKTYIKGLSDEKMLVSIPPNIVSGEVYVNIGEHRSNRYPFLVPDVIVGGLHMIDNPAVGSDGNIYATYSGGRGEQTTISVYKIDKHYEKEVYITGITNATSLLFKDEYLYIASRFDGKIYRTKEQGSYDVFSQGLGVAFGLAFNSKGEVYVGDRGGTIFKLDADGKAQVHASIPQSYIAFHMAFDKEDNLYVSNPVHMGYNSIYKIDKETGEKTVYYSALSLFHGFIIGDDNTFYITETKRNESRVIKVRDGKYVSTILTGTNFIGLTFDLHGNLIVATSMFLYLVKKESLL